MKKVIIFGLSLTLVLASIASFGMAQGLGATRGYASGPAIPDLTAEQISKIQSLQQAYLQKIEPLWQELKARRKELRSLWLTPNSDRAVVTAKEKEILAFQSKLQEKASNFRIEMRKVLTAEQQAHIGALSPGMKFLPGPRGRLGWGNPGSERMLENER